MKLTKIFLCMLALSTSAAYGEDISKHLDGDYLEYIGRKDRAGNPVLVVDSIEQFPYEYAKKLPPELYFWWAKLHNKKQHSKTLDNESSVLRVEQQGYGTENVPRTRYFNPRDTVKYHNSNNQKTLVRSFESKSHNGPATIYNPYYRP